MITGIATFLGCMTLLIFSIFCFGIGYVVGKISKGDRLEPKKNSLESVSK